MTTPAAPNPISMSQIAAEAGVSAPNEDLNNSSIRTLAGVPAPGTSISFSQLRDKSSFSGRLIQLTSCQFGTCTPVTFTVDAGVKNWTVLMIGGGGGGGVTGPHYGDGGGGGGAGGLVVSPTFPVSPGTSYTFSIGAGGRGGVGICCGNFTCGAGVAGGNGSGTSLSINCTLIVAPGGGGGGGAYQRRSGRSITPSTDTQQGKSGANGGGSSGNYICGGVCGVTIFQSCCSSTKYLPGGVGLARCQVTVPPDGSGWAYYGGNPGGAALDNGLNGGGGGATRAGATGFTIVPTGGCGLAPAVPSFPGQVPVLGGGGGAGGNGNNSRNDVSDCSFATYLGFANFNFNTVVTAGRLCAAAGGGGSGGTGVDLNGSQVNSAGTPGTQPGAGGGGGGGRSVTGGAGADGAIFIWET